jgi:hypothetical protein
MLREERKSDWVCRLTCHWAFAPEGQDVPAQSVSMDYAKEGAINIVFFVTDVHTSDQNGTMGSGIWRPAIAIMEKQALSLTKSEMRSAH